MSDPLDGVNAMFYLSLGTIICSSIALMIRYCYKSKCKEVYCFCFRIVRDVEVEKIEDLNINQTVSEEKN